MKNKIIILAFTFFVVAISAQQKGAIPQLPTANWKLPTSTYAVVVGISDYQDPGIPDLRFADKDAEAFANYLRSSAGGSLDEGHLKVLINSQATMAQFANMLDWLMENVKEGDQAIIYFSGHGDVEKKTITQPGFLLCWDSPAKVYMSGGAFALPMLQEVVSTLSIQSKAKVIVITDACRSGTLAGSSVGGSQATASNLAKQFANEIKILSCQPNEYSIEGEQWGGGRGAFSFHLLDALYGLADNDEDQWVTLYEVGRYLEDHVTKEVAPVSQLPMVLGNRNERLTSVDKNLLASIQSGKANQMSMLKFIDSKGLEDIVFSGLDTTIKELYQLFTLALKNKIFLVPKGKCADTYYEKLMAEPKLARLHSTMRRNYAAALQDDAQQVINTVLKTGLTKDILSGIKASQLYGNYPHNLERAAELLGNKHYMYSGLQARKYYFEGRIQKTKEESKLNYLKALQWQANLPHVYVALINIYNPEQLDSAEYYAYKAIDLAPTWVLPYIALSGFYEFKLNQFEKAEALLNQASQVDSNSVLVWYQKGRFYSWREKYEASEQWFKKVIASSGEGICFPCVHNELGHIYYFTKRYTEAEEQIKKAIQLDSSLAHVYNILGVVYQYTGRTDEAEKQYKKAIQLDSNFINAQLNLGIVYMNSKRFKEAEDIYLSILKKDSTNLECYTSLGLIYTYSNRRTEAENAFNEAIELDSTNSLTYYQYGSAMSFLKQTDKSFEFLEKAFLLKYDDYNVIINDIDLNFLKEQKDRWNTLMKKYFPDKIMEAK